MVDRTMTDAEFRATREYLGLGGEDLAERLGVTLRTLRRWEAGESPVPMGVAAELRQLEQEADHQQERLVAALAGLGGDVGLTIRREPVAYSAGWWRAFAARCARALPGLALYYRPPPSTKTAEAIEKIEDHLMQADIEFTDIHCTIGGAPATPARVTVWTKTPLSTEQQTAAMYAARRGVHPYTGWDVPVVLVHCVAENESLDG